MSRTTIAPNLVIEKRKRQSIRSLVQFPTNLGPHSMLFAFRKYTYEMPGSRSLLRMNNGTMLNYVGSQFILLPIASNLADNYNIRVNATNLGITGSEITGFLSKSSQETINGSIDFKKIFDSIKNSFPIETKDIYNAFTGKDISFGDDLLTLIRTQIGSTGNAIFNPVLGNTLNPKTTLLFEGSDLKTFSFSWMLAPQSESDSEALKNIINILKSNALPRYDGSIAGIHKIFLQYPNTVDIFLLGVDNDHYFKFKTSMVTQIGVDYTSASGLAFLKGGKPPVVQLTINITEIDIHTAEDYDNTLSYESTSSIGVGPR